MGGANPSGGDVVVVFEVAAYCWEVQADGDGMFFYFGGGPDAGEKE